MKRTIICSALAFLSIQANAQVEDISITLSPTASYNWFDKNTAIDDGLLVGGRVGFGFGEFFELRATYEKSLDLKNSINKIDELSDKFKEKFEKRNVNIERIGGEMKANIPTGGSFAPYITLGAGVQKLNGDKVDGKVSIPDMEQIFVAGGLGAKINLSDRIVLNIEAKNTAFNLDRTNILFQKSDEADHGALIKNTKEERMLNWSALAGLQIYLGGREPGTLSDLDRAYLRKFSGGLSGFKLVLEPGGSYIDFNKDSNYRDTYLLGGAAGVDFNQYVGLRGFYYQSTKDEKISTDFDKLAMYGGEVLARLNVARGISPYLTIGGGYMNVYNDYKGVNENLPAESSYFAKGGLGLNVPFGKNLEAFGSANLLYTTIKKEANKLQDIKQPDELTQHSMFNAGIRIKVGSNANEDEILNEKFSSNQSKYEERIQELEAELKKAYKSNDSRKAIRVIEEKKRLEEEAVEEQVLAIAPKKAHKKIEISQNTRESLIRLTPQELESLVDKVIKDIETEETEMTSMSNKERINRLEHFLLMREEKISPKRKLKNLSPTQKSSDELILNELERLNEKIEALEAKKETTSTNVSSDNTTDSIKLIKIEDSAEKTTKTTDTVEANENEETTETTPFLVNKAWSIDTGAVFGGGTAAKLGLRGHYAFNDSNFEFQPAVYFGVLGDSAFGANANFTYNLNFEKSPIVNPYIGAGVGYNKVNGDGKFGANLVVGTSFDLLNGNLYADYTALNLAKFNMVSVGYKFKF